MSKKKLKQHVLSACVIGAVMLASFQSVVAAEATKDVSQEFSDLRSTALRAELYLIGNEIETIHDLDMVDVVRIGCHYSIKNREDISSLIDVVVNAAVKQIPENKEGLDTRIVLRIYKDETHYTSLVMGQDYTDAPARGRYFGPSAGASGAIPPTAIFVEAQSGLQKGLRFWGGQHAALAVKTCRQ